MTRDEIVTALRCCASPEVNCKGNCAFFGMTTPVKEWSKLFAIVGECGGLDRLRELAEADKAGRLVVLPVKPVLTPILSSMLYIIDDGYIYEDALYEADVGMSESGKTNVVYTTLSDMMVFEQADIGKTVFLTREEAEKALEAMKK